MLTYLKTARISRSGHPQVHNLYSIKHIQDKVLYNAKEQFILSKFYINNTME
jgi:hypothetical protein